MKTHFVSLGLPALLLVSAALSIRTAALDHLGPPQVYDNLGGTQYVSGQTFVADEEFMSGVRLYIGDPTRPDNNTVNELTGLAFLLLYDASNNLIASSQVITAAEGIAGLVTLRFETAVPTIVGGTYFFGILADDYFGAGLRALNSTYDNGAEAVRDIITGQIFPHPAARDLSFSVLSSAFPDAGDLDDGLVASYSFNGNAQDESGNGHHGVVQGATLTTDRFGSDSRAYRFNDISSKIEIASPFPMQDQQTVVVWINPNVVDTRQTVFEKSVPGWGGEVDFEMRFEASGQLT